MCEGCKEMLRPSDDNYAETALEISVGRRYGL